MQRIIRLTLKRECDGKEFAEILVCRHAWIVPMESRLAWQWATDSVARYLYERGCDVKILKTELLNPYSDKWIEFDKAGFIYPY